MRAQQCMGETPHLYRKLSLLATLVETADMQPYLALYVIARAALLSYGCCWRQLYPVQPGRRTAAV